MLKNDSEGVTPLYREKNWKRIERVKEKEVKRKSWYRNGKEKAEAVFFVRSTPGGHLAEECKKVSKKANLKLKVIEKTGTSVKKNLVKSNPFKKTGCEKGCIICRKGKDCKARGVHYRISCETGGCEEARYEGETSRSTGERFPEAGLRTQVCKRLHSSLFVKIEAFSTKSKSSDLTCWFQIRISIVLLH